MEFEMNINNDLYEFTIKRNNIISFYRSGFLRVVNNKVYINDVDWHENNNISDGKLSDFLENLKYNRFSTTYFNSINGSDCIKIDENNIIFEFGVTTDVVKYYVENTTDNRLKLIIEFKKLSDYANNMIH